MLESFSSCRFSRSYRFDNQVREIRAATTGEVLPALRRIEAAVAEGYHAAGFISYEAASAINPDLATHRLTGFPLLWFGIFRERVVCNGAELEDSAFPAVYNAADWRPSLDSEAYAEAVRQIKEHIAAGETYQANFTLRQRFSFSGDPLAFYRDLCRAQRVPFSAYLPIGDYRVLSASPELFFALKDGVLTTRPMKGTAKRGRWYEEDCLARINLQESEKERAENLMIVDLLRNDMGMVAATGSVQVDSLFEIETLETVHQMTSTITSRLRSDVGITELFQALFPCGSVTGAPKKRTMEIIAGLEDSPRGLYTGCIGYISPGPEAVFSVAIRTAVIDTVTGQGVLGVGSGVTWDSGADAEYEECLAKGFFARHCRPEFQLIESLLFEEDKGLFLLERHLLRLSRSAAYFAFSLDQLLLRETLARRTAPLKGAHKLRVLLSRNGAFSITSEPLAGGLAPDATVVLAATPVDSANPFLYHKTSNRDLYSAELAKHPACLDVIFLNERGEVTEGATTNIVAKIGGELVTPPLQCGLLPGVYREELLAGGEIRERIITREELATAEEIFLLNSVRKWRRARLA